MSNLKELFHKRKWIVGAECPQFKEGCTVYINGFKGNNTQNAIVMYTEPPAGDSGYTPKSKITTVKSEFLSPLNRTQMTVFGMYVQPVVDFPRDCPEDEKVPRLKIDRKDKSFTLTVAAFGLLTFNGAFLTFDLLQDRGSAYLAPNFEHLGELIFDTEGTCGDVKYYEFLIDYFAGIYNNPTLLSIGPKPSFENSNGFRNIPIYLLSSIRAQNSDSAEEALRELRTLVSAKEYKEIIEKEETLVQGTHAFKTGKSNKYDTHDFGAHDVSVHKITRDGRNKRKSNPGLRQQMGQPGLHEGIEVLSQDDLVRKFENGDPFKKG